MTTDLGKIKNNFDQFIVRPANLFGLGGFIFDVEGDTTYNLQSQITDHYVEDNTAIQDHIAISPLSVSLGSFVGELVYEDQPEALDDVKDLVQKLTILSAALPTLTNGVAQIKNVVQNGIKVDDIGQTALGLGKTVFDLWTATKNLNPGASKQQQAYLYFEALHKQKILVSLQTPLKYITNMAVESIVATQGEDTKYVSSFTITLKEIRTASTILVPTNGRGAGSIFQGRTSQQREEAARNGKAQGKKENTSILYDLAGSLGSVL